MPYSPLVSKIRVHNPNKKSSLIANRNYLRYIATREGVSLERVHQEADNEQYLRYMAKRPRSHGLFGNIDTEDLKEVSSQAALTTKNFFKKTSHFMWDCEIIKLKKKHFFAST